MPSAQSQAIFSAVGHGSRSAYCSGFRESVKIESVTTESRESQTFYPRHVYAGDFEVILTFRSEDDRDAFSAWMYDYAKKLSSGTANSMQVTIPALDFSSFGVPTGNFDYEQTIGQNPARMAVRFERTDGLTKVTGEPVIASNDVVIRFYPNGLQASGPVSGEQNLYDQANQILTGQIYQSVAFDDTGSSGSPTTPVTPPTRDPDRGAAPVGGS